jgi:hypothetical protein
MAFFIEDLLVVMARVLDCTLRVSNNDVNVEIPNRNQHRRV